MTTEQIKDYLKKYRIDSEEQLAKHIEELKRNTIPNNEIIFPLVDLLVNEKAVLNSFFAENKKQEMFTRTVTPFFLDEMLGKCSTQCFCDGSCKKPQKNLVGYDKSKVKQRYNFGLTEQLNTVVGDLEGINRLPTHNEKLVFIKDGIGFNYLKRLLKDDVITSSSRGEKETMEYLQGVKESQTAEKAPIFTYCKVNKNALEALSLRALYGHNKYKETDQDWQNFTRVPNALEEYGNALFRHALGIGEEDEETHLVAEAWNAVAKLEVFLRNKLNKS